ncbi:MAG: response regulator [Planctomycetota bacterium]
MSLPGQAAPRAAVQNAVPLEVLYVDDFEPERALLAHRLRGSSITLSSLPSVELALGALHARRYHGVLCDLHLGGGRSGEELLRACQEQGLHDGPFVFVSGESRPERLRELVARGASAVLTKPVDTAALESLLLSLVQGSPQACERAADPAELTNALPGCVDQLRAAVSRSDARTALCVCRDLASTASGFGLTHLARTAEQAVGALGGGIDTDTAHTAIHVLVTQIGEALSNAA